MTRSLPFVVLILALAACTTVAALVDRGPYDRVPMGEEAPNWTLALQAAEGTVDTGVFRQIRSPLYPRFLQGLASDETGGIRNARRWSTILTLPLLALLVFGIIRSVAGPWSSVVGAVSVALLSGAVLSAGRLTGAAPAAVLVLLGLFVLGRRPTWVLWILAGLLTGVAAGFYVLVGWSTLIALVVGSILNPGRPRRWIAPLLLVASWLLGVGATSWVASGQASIPLVSGMEVYRGHRPPASGVDPFRGDSDPQKWRSPRSYQAQANREAGRRLTGAELDRTWALRGLTASLRAPHRELTRAVVRGASLAQADPIPKTVGVGHLIEQGNSPILSTLVWLGRILIPLGLAGILVGMRRLGLAWGIGLATGAVAFTVTYAEPGARLVTLCLVGGGVSLFLDSLRSAARWRALGLGVLMVGLFGVLPWLLPLPGMSAPAVDAYYLGNLFETEGRGSAAMREYDRALRLDPDSPFPRVAIGRSLAADQVYEEAMAELERVREQYPNSFPALAALGQVYQARERWPEAILIQEELVRLDPTDPEFHNNLGTSFLPAGLYQRAEASFLRALELDPNFAAAKENLRGMKEQNIAYERGDEATDEQIVVRIREGKLDEAEALLARAYAEQGAGDPSLQMVEGILRIQQGRFADAVTLLEPLQELQEENPFFRHNLAAALAQSGRAMDGLTIWADLYNLYPANQVFRNSLVQVRQQLVNEAGVAREANDPATERAIWQALVDRFPDETAFADSLAAADKR